nr:ribosome recycling factor [bacterium]
ASAAMLEPIIVDYYGSKTPVTQAANVSIPEPRMIIIKPWDANMIDSICKAILASDIGITPQPDKNIIRLNVPQMTEETRKKIVKLAKTKCEDCKVAVRNVRRDINAKLQEIQKSSKITEDDYRKGLKVVQDITDENIKDIEDIYQKKEKDILEV